LKTDESDIKIPKPSGKINKDTVISDEYTYGEKITI